MSYSPINKKVSLLIICSFIYWASYSQQGSISKIYFPSERGFFNCIEKVPDGYLTTGALIDPSFNLLDSARIAKIDDQGQLVWAKKIKAGYGSKAYPRLCRLTDGKIAWADLGLYINAAVLEIVIFDSLGNNIVSKKIITHNLVFLRMAATSDGGFIVTGFTNYSTGVYKFDNMLNLLWQEEIENIFGTDLDIDSIGRIFITNGTVTVLDSIGNIVDSCRVFSDIDNLSILPDGYFLVGKDTNQNPFMAKVDFNWNLVWYKSVIVPNIILYHEGFAENGKLFMFSLQYGGSANDTAKNIFTVLDSSGNLIDNYSISMLDTSHYFQIGGICTDNKGGLTTTGIFYINNNFRCSMIQINDTIPSCSWDKVTLPVVSGLPYPTPIVTPYIYAVNYSYTPYTLVVSNPLGSFDLCISSVVIENEISNNFQMFPNPAINITTITAPNFINSSLIIYDITGRTLLQQPFNTKATIDLSPLTNGIYMIEVKDKEGRRAMGKVVKE